MWVDALESTIFLSNHIGLISSGLKIWLLIKEQLYIWKSLKNLFFDSCFAY